MSRRQGRTKRKTRRRAADEAEKEEDEEERQRMRQRMMMEEGQGRKTREEWNIESRGCLHESITQFSPQASGLVWQLCPLAICGPAATSFRACVGVRRVVRSREREREEEHTSRTPLLPELLEGISNALSLVHEVHHQGAPFEGMTPVEA